MRSKFAMLHITRRRDATSNTLQMRPSPQQPYNNSKQQSAKRGGMTPLKCKRRRACWGAPPSAPIGCSKDKRASKFVVIDGALCRVTGSGDPQECRESQRIYVPLELRKALLMRNAQLPPLDYCLGQAPAFEVDAQANGSVVLLEYHGEGHSGI